MCTLTFHQAPQETFRIGPFAANWRAPRATSSPGPGCTRPPVPGRPGTRPGPGTRHPALLDTQQAGDAVHQNRWTEGRTPRPCALGSEQGSLRPCGTQARHRASQGPALALGLGLALGWPGLALAQAQNSPRTEGPRLRAQ